MFNVPSSQIVLVFAEKVPSETKQLLFYSASFMVQRTRCAATEARGAAEACQAHYESSGACWGQRGLRGVRLARVERSSPGPQRASSSELGPSGRPRCSRYQSYAAGHAPFVPRDVNMFYPSGVQTEHWSSSDIYTSQSALGGR